MPKLDQRAILDAVHDLPEEERIEIARQILIASDSEQVGRLSRVPQQVIALQSWLREMPAVPLGDKKASATSLRGIARMENPPDDATVVQCVNTLTVLPVEAATIRLALAQPGADFEDNILIARAVLNAVGLIATCDADGYKQSPVPAVDPRDVTAHLPSA